MTQRITYIAYDGTEFEDELDCINYEMICDLCKGTLKMYIGDKEVCKDVMITDETYNAVTKIIVNSEYDLELLRRLENEYGFMSYSDINSVGTWMFKTNDGLFALGNFIKVKD